MVYLFVPETAYNRPPVQQRYTDAEIDLKDNEEKVEIMNTAEVTLEAGTVDEKHSFVRSLRIFTGRYTTQPFLRILLRPFVVFFYPAVLWAFLMYGTTLTWIVVFSVVNASIFTVAPYNFTVSQTGLISLSPFVFTLVGELVSGPLNDWLCVWLSKRNRGVYEPEFRLPLVIIPLFLGVAGFYGFGATVNYQTHWSGPVICFGLANMALAFLNCCVFGYVLDAHGDLSEEGKSDISFIFRCLNLLMVFC